MISMKKQLEDMGILTKKEVSIDSFKCAVDKCTKVYQTQATYKNHLTLKHPEFLAQINSTRATVPEILYPSNPFESNQTVNQAIAIDQTNYSTSCATAWSVVRLGYADTFCEEIKKMMKMQQTFYRAPKEMRPNNNFEPFTSVTRTSFRKTILSMANNIKEQLLERIKQSPFYSFHIGETIDIQPCSHLLVIVRYKYKKTITEDLLFSQILNLQSTQNEIFVIIDTVVRNSGLDWKKCVAISMDGERASTGPLKNVAKCVRENYLSIRIAYTLSRRGEFIMHNVSRDLKEVLTDVIKLVNEFKMDDGVKLSDQIKMKYKNLLIHTETYWLSYGHNVLQTMFHMAQYREVSFRPLAQLAFLVDIIEHFDQLNDELQKREATIFHVYDHISAMYDKLGTYNEEIRNNNFTAFPNLSEIFKGHAILPNDVKAGIKGSLKMLRKKLKNYLPMPQNERADYEWVCKPFGLNECPAVFETRDEVAEWEQFKKDTPEFNGNNFESFWVSKYQKYPSISERAIKFLLIFPNSRFYENGFAAFVDMRTNHVTDLNSEDLYLRIKLSPIKPNVS